jgi:mannosyltransferase
VAAVTAPPPGIAAPDRQDVSGWEPRTPDWVRRIPAWLWIGGGIIALMALSAVMRAQYLSGQLWMDEAITTGLSHHALSAIPGVLRYDGNPPLYYLLLHVWMSLFGTSEAATHSLSLMFGVLTIPVGTWACWTIFGRRAGIMAALLFAFNAWLTSYAQETRMYELMALLGVLATTGFLLGFVIRRRRFLWLFGGALALMLYTHSWGTFFFAGSIIALVPAYLASDDRRGLIRDAVITYVTAGVLFLPWVPTLLYQVAHTAAPWDSSPKLGAPVQISRDLLGGDRITMILVFSAIIGLAPLFTRKHRRTREWTTLWTLIALPVATLVLAWISSQLTPAWASRYFAPVLGSLLFLVAWGCARARILGIVAVALSLLYLHNPAVFSPQYKSDMRDVGAEVAPMMHPGDLVVVGQPEQTPLSWYYLPGGLKFANTAGGLVKDPTYFDWVDALKRLQHTQPSTTVDRLVNGMAPGQQLLFVRPLTEGAQNWQAPWTKLVRRRSAQWSQVLSNDVSKGTLRPVATAPHNYRGACCVADSAMLYRKVS